MGIFNLPGLDNEMSRATVADAIALTSYSYHNLDNGLAWGYQHYGMGLGLPAMLWTALFGNGSSEGIFSLPWNPDSEAKASQTVNDAGWTVITAEQLGYDGVVDKRGTFMGEKPGYQTAQVEILGKYDESGKLIQLGISFRGTSGPRESLIRDTLGDLIIDLKAAFLPESFASNFAQEAFGNLLSAVANFAAQNGLTGSDITVTGHSLGGMAVNSLASLSDSQWNGFYSDARYVSFASPTQNTVNDKVLNVGFENDPVFRVLDGANMNLSTLLVHDKPHESTTDNIVNFNDYYASNLWNMLPQSLLNLPAWISHMPFFYQQAVTSILKSEFYDLTERDSTVIVSTLSDAWRGSTWVEDLNRYAEKHTGPTFILGSEGNDLIKGHGGVDYLEGRGGNDTFCDNGGFNTISGGEGVDTFDLYDTLKNRQVAYDGETLYVRNKAGEITLAKGVEYIKSAESFLFFFKKGVMHQVTDEGLRSSDGLVNYAASSRGDAQHNTLSGAKGNWLFGLEGNDTLTGMGQNTFVGGEGNDRLIATGQDNTFLFEGKFGNDTVYNFSSNDQLVFMGVEGATHGNFRDFASQESDGVRFDFGDSSVKLVGVNMDALNDAQVVLA